MLKSNAAGKKGGGSTAAAGSNPGSGAVSPTAAAAAAVAPIGSAASPSSSNRVSLLDLCALTKDGKSGKESFAVQTAELNLLRAAPPPGQPSLLIVDVWQHNLREVFEKIMFLVDEFPYVGMDAEFPGVIARPLTTASAAQGGRAALQSYHYNTIKLNVDLLKLIQLGLCFISEQGEIAKGTPGSTPASPHRSQAASNAAAQPGGICYQFHFRFNLDTDMYAQDSIDLLQSAGIDFARHATQGIEISEFAELFMTSGVILNEEIRWITFHSGYDFAYLLHLLLGGGGGSGGQADSANTNLPATESEFFELVQLYFPCIYDVKELCRHLPASAQKDPLAAELAHGGLNKLASTLKLGRIGSAHQAGSDALLTAALFFKLRELYFPDLAPPTVAQIQQAQAQAQATAAAADSAKPDSVSAAGGAKDAAGAADDAVLALQSSYQAIEERYLNFLYGLSPIANTLLRQSRERERAATGPQTLSAKERAEGAESLSISVSTANSVAGTSAADSKDSSATSTRPPSRSVDRSPHPFKPSSSGQATPEFS